MIIAIEIATFIRKMGHAVASTPLTGEDAIGFAEQVPNPVVTTVRALNRLRLIMAGKNKSNLSTE